MKKTSSSIITVHSIEPHHSIKYEPFLGDTIQRLRNRPSRPWVHRMVCTITCRLMVLWLRHGHDAHALIACALLSKNSRDGNCEEVSKWMVLSSTRGAQKEGYLATLSLIVQRADDGAANWVLHNAWAWEVRTFVNTAPCSRRLP